MIFNETDFFLSLIGEHTWEKPSLAKIKLHRFESAAYVHRIKETIQCMNLLCCQSFLINVNSSQILWEARQRPFALPSKYIYLIHRLNEEIYCVSWEYIYVYKYASQRNLCLLIRIFQALAKHMNVRNV
jgi:hypothetical protein